MLKNKIRKMNKTIENWSWHIVKEIKRMRFNFKEGFKECIRKGFYPEGENIKELRETVKKKFNHYFFKK